MGSSAVATSIFSERENFSGIFRLQEERDSAILRKFIVIAEADCRGRVVPSACSC